MRTEKDCNEILQAHGGRRRKFFYCAALLALGLAGTIITFVVQAAGTEAKQEVQIEVHGEKIKTLTARTDNIEKNMARQVRLLEDIHDEVVKP